MLRTSIVRAGYVGSLARAILPQNWANGGDAGIRTLDTLSGMTI